MEDDLNFILMEEDYNIFAYGEQPHLESGDKLIWIMEDNLNHK